MPFVLFLLAAVAAFAPVTLPASSEPDLSYHAVLHQSWQSGWVFGRDLRVTFGPWGFLFCGYDPRTWRVSWVAALLLAIAFAFGAWALLRGRPRAIVFGIAASGLMAFGGPDVRFFAIPVLLLLLLIRDNDTMATPVVAAAAGLVSLVKFSYLVASLVVLVPLARRRPIAAATFAAAFVVFWLVAAQPLSALPSFLLGGADVISGYAGGAALPPRSWFVIVPLIAAAAVISAAGRERHVDAIVAITMLALLLGKSALVRADDVHMLAAAVTLLILAIGLRIEMTVPIQILLAVATLPLIATHWMAIAKGATPLRAAYEQRSEREWMSRLAGRVDAYPFGAAPLINGGSRYVPRPDVESYMAFSPELMHADLEHLTGANAPDDLVFFVSPVDGHLPSSEDSLSWPAIAARYELKTRVADDVAILRRRASPLRIARTPLTARAAAANEWIDIPANAGSLWCAIDVEPGFADRIESLLIRPKAINLDVRTADGVMSHYRVVPAVAREGFVLSPLIRTTNDFVAWTEAQPLPARRVVAIRSAQAMRLRFSALDLAR